MRTLRDANGEKVDADAYYRATDAFVASPFDDRREISARKGDLFRGDSRQVQGAPDKFVLDGEPMPLPRHVIEPLPDHSFTPPRPLVPVEDLRIATRSFVGASLGIVVTVNAGDRVHKDDELTEAYAQHFRRPTKQEIEAGNREPGRTSAAA